MPAQHPKPAEPSPKPAAPPKPPPKWVIAKTYLYVGGQPGTGAMPQLAHRPGDRVSYQAAKRNGWLDSVRPATDQEASR
jgi:hypothetical protein